MVGLGHDRVAGGDRRDPVDESHREGVVPRRDDRDHALGRAVLLDVGEEGDDAVALLGRQVPLHGPAVVARGEGDVQRLVEGVDPGLAGLPTDEVHDLLAPVEDEVTQAQQHRRALGIRGQCPVAGRLARPCERGRHIVRGGDGHAPQRLAGRRGVHHHRLAGRRDQALSETSDEGLVQGIGGGKDVFGVQQAGAVRSGTLTCRGVGHDRA